MLTTLDRARQAGDGKSLYGQIAAIPQKRDSSEQAPGASMQEWSYFPKGDTRMHSPAIRFIGAAFFLLAIAGGAAGGNALADQAYSSNRSGNGHNGVTFTTNTEISYTANANGWNAWHTEAWMQVTNGGSALCDRSRLFSSGWTQIGNKNWAGSPFPFSSGAGWQFDYFDWPYPAASWAMRSWWQIDDAFSGSVCSYGGGVGIYKASSGSSPVTETVPSP